MPARSFQTASRRATRRKKPAPIIFTERHRDLLIDRLEDATRSGMFSPAEIDPIYSRLLLALFPSDFTQPKEAVRATDAEIGTADRVEVYAARVENGERIWHHSDVETVGKDVQFDIVARALAMGCVAAIE